MKPRPSKKIGNYAAELEARKDKIKVNTRAVADTLLEEADANWKEANAKLKEATELLKSKEEVIAKLYEEVAGAVATNKKGREETTHRRVRINKVARCTG